MSKIGKKPIEIPSGVSVEIKNDHLSVKGPKGELMNPMIQGVNIAVEGNLVRLSLKDEKKGDSARWGLQRSLVANMVIGVTRGFEKVL